MHASTFDLGVIFFHSQYFIFQVQKNYELITLAEQFLCENRATFAVGMPCFHFTLTYSYDPHLISDLCEIGLTRKYPSLRVHLRSSSANSLGPILR